MGLDNYWKKEGVEGIFELKFNPPLKLIGGLLSNNGCGSFRGKCYSQLIEDLTGVSLYQDKISNEIIKDMALKLSSVKFKKSFGIKKQEFEDLTRMFVEYAKEGGYLISWY